MERAIIALPSVTGKGVSRIDDEKDAWNDTFSHPDSTHYLTDGDALMIPGLMVRAGVAGSR